MEQRFDYYKRLAKEFEAQRAYPQGNKKIPIRGFLAAASPDGHAFHRLRTVGANQGQVIGAHSLLVPNSSRERMPKI